MDLSKLKGILPDHILEILPETFEKYGINTVLRAAHFLSQIAHESGNFTIKTENMRYTTASRIVAIWPSRFNLDGSDGKKNANEYVNNPEKLAEATYGNRKSLGNDQPGDGFRYRGGGFLQLTGKDAYKAYADYLKKDVGATADLIRSDDHYALDSALWEYVMDKKLNTVADLGAGDDVITRVTKVVNGGTIGLEERKKLFHKYFDALNSN